MNNNWQVNGSYIPFPEATDFTLRRIGTPFLDAIETALNEAGNQRVTQIRLSPVYALQIRFEHSLKDPTRAYYGEHTLFGVPVVIAGNEATFSLVIDETQS